MNEEIQHSNIAEEEMGQLHAIHLNLNAIAAVQRRLPSGPGCKDCVDCGVKIPVQRREAMPGCIRCTCCQTAYEHQK